MLAPFRVPLADNLSGFDLDAAIAMGGDDSAGALVKAIGAVDLGFDCGSDCGELVGVGHASLRWRLVVFHFRVWLCVLRGLAGGGHDFRFHTIASLLSFATASRIPP
jgi:hypothetical protein